MSKVILYIAASLDGYIATEDGGVGWLDEFEQDSNDYGFHKFIDSTDINIMGANTYKQILSLSPSWPYQTQSYIASSKQLDVPEGAAVEFINDTPENLVKMAKQQAAKDIWLIGGATLAQSFLKDQQIDELILTVMPLTLGGGIALFGNTGVKTRVKLLNMETYDSGAYQVHYRVMGPHHE